jgi:prepilin-type N-terminal cleavage/methylation domain-containing protein
VNSERARRLGEEGFTLIEVLVAMMILAVGLLGLEALGIGAARSLTLAEAGSELVVVGTEAMEKGQQKVRRQLLVPPATVTTGSNCESRPTLTVCTDVQTRASLGVVPTRNARLTVTVTPARVQTDTFRITSYVYDPALP